MRRGSHRHPVLETAVFAAAILLAAFVLRELWHRRPAAPPAGPETSGPAAVRPERPDAPVVPGTRRTETAVKGVPPLKLSGVRPGRSKRPAVPQP